MWIYALALLGIGALALVTQRDISDDPMAIIMP
jgi:hypothetical protein